MNDKLADKIELGISACLLGQEVRFDGGHRQDTYITNTLAEFFEFIPICPELAIGLGVPRPPIQLVGKLDHPRALGVYDSSLDVTEKLAQFSLTQTESLGHISGYILKEGSPSCGMERVKVYRIQGVPPLPKGSGIFARILMEQYPLLPVEEEGRLNDLVLRENFINRIFVYRRWQNLLHKGLTSARLIDFHSHHKYLVLAHSQAAYQRMGHLLSNLKKDLDATSDLYITELMTTLRRRVTRKRHVNVLQHIMDYLKKHIDRADKTELLNSIESYKRGEVPLVVPVTLLKHFLHSHPDYYIQHQYYLCPYPENLGLRNQL